MRYERGERRRHLSHMLAAHSERGLPGKETQQKGKLSHLGCWYAAFGVIHEACADSSFEVPTPIVVSNKAASFHLAFFTWVVEI